MPISVDRSAAETLQDQIFDKIKCLILSHKLKPGSKLPASRQLAIQLDISRNTVTLAYDRLAADGYVVSRPAAGNFVAYPVTEVASLAGGRGSAAPAQLRAPAFLGRSFPPTPRFDIDFGLRAVGHDDFPIKQWRRRIDSLLCHHDGRIGQNPPPGGEPRLRRALADWLAKDRGLTCDPDEVLVVSGCQQAYTVATQILIRPGDRVVVEAPAHLAATLVFEAMGAELVHVPVDEHGLMVDALPDGPAALVYLTPSHQNPVGGILPLDRRLRLIEWAHGAGACIFEDDCNGEQALCWNGRPVPSLKALDPHGLVIYAGTFTKTLGAGLRLGYMVLPPDLVVTGRSVKQLMDGGNPWLEQMALAGLIESGAYAAYLQDLGRLWRARRQCLIDEMRQAFGSLSLLGTQSGTHVTWLLPDDLPDASVLAEAAAAVGIGVFAIPQLGRASATPPLYADRALYLNYSALSEDNIRKGIGILAGIIRVSPRAYSKAC